MKSDHKAKAVEEICSDSNGEGVFATGMTCRSGLSIQVPLVTSLLKRSSCVAINHSVCLKRLGLVIVELQEGSDLAHTN